MHNIVARKKIDGHIKLNPFEEKRIIKRKLITERVATLSTLLNV